MDISGTESTEILFGTESSENIFGFAGSDTLQALGGDDAIFGNQDNDWIDCGQGFDTVYGGKNDDFILGGFDDDYLRGDLESDEIYGEDGDDSLFGGKFPDTLIGGNGNDNLYGDLGSDILTGGEGADFFWLRPEGEGTDEITDYQDGVDSLMLPDDLTFNDLIIQPGNGNQTIISIANTGEQLVILENVSSDNVTAEDFEGTIPLTEEPTNSLSNTIDLGNLDGTQTQSDAVGDNNPIDVYRFTLDAPKDLNLQLQGLSADADLYLIEDVNGNNLFDAVDEGPETSAVIDSSSNGENQSETINFTQLPAGTYFVGVSQYEGETNYDLTLTATGFTPQTDWLDDTPETAFDIGVLQSEQIFQDFVGSSDSNDYYKFTLNGLSDFYLFLENLTADADVELTNSTGNVIDYSINSGNNPEEIQSLDLAAGEYYVRVYSTPESNTDYDLTFGPIL